MTKANPANMKKLMASGGSIESGVQCIEPQQELFPGKSCSSKIQGNGGGHFLQVCGSPEVRNIFIKYSYPPSKRKWSAFIKKRGIQKNC